MIIALQIFSFCFSKDPKYGINDEDNPPPNNKLTIKSGNVKELQLHQFLHLPLKLMSNHSLIKPAILPIKMKEETTIVEFFIDNFFELVSIL